MTSLAFRNTKRILSLNINVLSYKETLDQIIVLAQSKKSSYICFANVHMTIEAYKDQIFANQVNDAAFVLPDGMPLVKVLKFFYGHSQDRIAGMDAFPNLMQMAGINNLKVFFFGTTPELLEKIRIRTKKEFPKMTIAGLLSPPFDKSLDDESYIDTINSSGAALVFVALGCPKQEKWMAKHSHNINAVLLGVGNAFSIYVGEEKRAPMFMRNLSLEWLYRLSQAPNRLFKRYLTTNTMFIYLILKTKMKNLFNIGEG